MDNCYPSGIDILILRTPVVKHASLFFFMLTITVLKNHNPPLLWFCLIRIYHGCSYYKVSAWILPQLTGHQAEGVFILQKLVSVQD